MEEIMQSNSYFIIPLTLAYLSICGLWFLLNKTSNTWNISPIESTTKPLVDLVIGLLACICVMGVGQLFSAGFLIPRSEVPVVNQLIIWPLNNVLIFSPIFLTLIVRKQGLSTIFISSSQVGPKLLFGLVASVIGIVIFVGIRGEWSRLKEIAFTAILPEKLSNFPAIFFENVAIAFLFIRLKWAVGIRWAIAIPSVLFALAHVPGSLAEGDPNGHIITFFFLTGSLTTFILYTAYRSRDILWLGVVHYLMDVAIKAF